jgi:hypothetical protein
MESSGVADIVRRNVQVYGISSDGSTWSLQQELLANVTVDYTDLSSTDKKINGTSLFTNQDTLIANLYGPGIGYSYIFRPSLAGTWSLQQVISGLDVGAQVFFPVVQGGMLLHGASGGKVVQHTRFQNGSCILIYLTDHFLDGWDTAILTVLAPYQTKDSFNPQ